MDHARVQLAIFSFTPCLGPALHFFVWVERISVCCLQGLPLRFEWLLLAFIDQLGPLTNGAVGMKASTDVQHRRLFGQGIDMLGLSNGFVVCLCRTFAQLRPHRACFNRSQLIFVTQQNQSGFKGDALHEASHELQINHGRFIDHHQIGGQHWRRSGGSVGVVLEQLMQGNRLRWNTLCPSFWQAGQCILNGGAQATGRFACWRGQMNTQSLMTVLGRLLQQS